MSGSSGSGRTKDPKQRAADTISEAQSQAARRALDVASAQAAHRRSELRAEYVATTASLYFTKEFHDHNAAVMLDPFQVIAVRYLAWARRNAWGEDALFAIYPDGRPKYQVDAARELGIKPRALSKAQQWCVLRGYLEDQPKLIVPVPSPVLTGPAPGTDAKSPEWAHFCELWNVANSADFERYEAARVTVAQIRKTRLSDYKKWREQEKKARASLLETARHGPDPGNPQPPTPFESDVRRRRSGQTDDKTPSVDGGMQSGDRTRSLLTAIAMVQRSSSGTVPTAAGTVLDASNPEHQKILEQVLEKLGTEEDLIGYAQWLGHRKAASLDQLVRLAEDYARISGGAAPAPRGAPPAQSPPIDADAILDAVAVYVPADDDYVARLIAEVRAAAPDATQEEMLFFIADRAPHSKGKKVRNPGGFLKSAVVNCFLPQGLAKHRQHQQEMLDADRRAADQDLARELEAQHRQEVCAAAGREWENLPAAARQAAGESAAPALAKEHPKRWNSLSQPQRDEWAQTEAKRAHQRAALAREGLA